MANNRKPIQPNRIRKIDCVLRKGYSGADPRSLSRKESRPACPPQKRHNRTPPVTMQHWCDRVPTARCVRPSMQQQNRGAIGRTFVFLSDFENVVSSFPPASDAVVKPLFIYFFLVSAQRSHVKPAKPPNSLLNKDIDLAFLLHSTRHTG